MMVITMASYAANATSGGARKAAWAKIIMLLYYYESEKGFMLRKIPNR